MNKFQAFLCIALLIFLSSLSRGVRAQPADQQSCSVPASYGLLNTDNWSITQQDNGTATFVNDNEVSLSCNADGKNKCVVRIISKNYLSGDYSISVDLDKYTNSYVSGQSFVFIMNLSSEKIPYSYRLGVHQNDKGKYIEFNPTINNESFVSSSIFALNDLANLTLTIEKKGSVMSGYLIQDGIKRLVSSVNGYPSDGSFIPYFVVSNSPGSDVAKTFGSMQTTFSNVKAICTKVQLDVTPTLTASQSSTVEGPLLTIESVNTWILFIAGGIILLIIMNGVLLLRRIRS